MSVKIKGMYLPENCLLCPLCILNDYGERVCYATANIRITEFDVIYSRNENCPMEETED